MAALQTGLYAIRHVRSQNQLQLPDPNDGSPVQATSEALMNSVPLRWNVVLLGNGKYNIQHQQTASYANCGHRARDGDEVVGRNNKQQFLIQETRVKNRYTISPTDVQLCWGLPDDELGSGVVLAKSYTDARNQWEFVRLA